MRVILLKPQGYCHGVNLAISKLENAINDNNIEKPIYLLGEIIHNKFVIDYYKKQGVILIKETDDKLESLKNIKNGTVILQAHGTSPEIYDYLVKNKINYIDATCPYVKIIHKRINIYATNKYDIIYIGKKNHAESLAAIKQNNHVHFVTSLEEIAKLNITNEKIYVTNQTTLSIYDLQSYFSAILEKYPHAIIDNKICDATTKRQTAITQGPKVDLIIVVGDKTSSNSKRLYELALAKGKALFIESVSELIGYNFSDIETVAITSGASTPSNLVSAVEDFLKSL